jgi:hypothetical protein
MRILVLGESHYDFGLPAEEASELTNRVVLDHIHGAHRHKFLRNVSQVVLGLDAPESQAVGFWNAAAFYNYVQAYAGHSPGDRPAATAWQAAASPFLHVLDQLRPQLVLVCGIALWLHVRELPTNTEVIAYDPPFRRCRLWRAQTTSPCVAGVIRHPSGSRAFRSAEWYPHVQFYVSEARRIANAASR